MSVRGLLVELPGREVHHVLFSGRMTDSDWNVDWAFAYCGFSVVNFTSLTVALSVRSLCKSCEKAHKAYERDRALEKHGS